MKFNEPITIIKNVLDKEDLELLYSLMDNAEEVDMHIHPTDSKITYFGKVFPYHIREKVLAKVQEFYSTPLTLTGSCLVRYKSMNGDQPVLKPHTDTQPVHPGPRLSISLQLRKNIDWSVVVEGEHVMLQENEAVVFSGTHQIHWRDPINFAEDNYLDILLDSYSTDELQYTEIPQEEKNIIAEKYNYWFNKYLEKVNNGNSTNDNN